jgi:dTDP-4-dehydrorhamnose reductase
MILVTGSGGMVGSYLLDSYRPEELFLTDLNQTPRAFPLDVRNSDEVSEMVRRVRPTCVLHLAAETDVDLCEREVDHAFQTNTIGTYNVALACLENNADMVYVSTTAIFDGDKEAPYNEFDTPLPTTVYSKTKYEGEQIVRDICPKWYILRAGWMYGGGALDKKFVGKVASQCARGKTELRAVDDKYGTPTYGHDLVANIKFLMTRQKYGLYHVVDRGGRCTRYDVAVEIANHFDRGIQVSPVSSTEFALSASRSKSEAAVSYKLDLLGLNRMRPWREALHEYLDTAWAVNKNAPPAMAASV